MALQDLLTSRAWAVVVDLRAYDGPDTAGVLESLGRSTCYLLLSTIYVYAHPRFSPQRELRRLREADPLEPNGPYGPAKVRAEQALMRADSRDRYVLRLPFVSGPGDRSGRREAMRSYALSQTADVDGLDYEVGLVSAASVATTLARLLEIRPVGPHVFNVDAGANWTLAEHVAAAARTWRGSEPATAPADPPYAVGRDFSLDSRRLYEVIGRIEEDIDAEWLRIVRPA
jgi:nucleoside-diphosphate-sugar epimerase